MWSLPWEPGLQDGNCCQHIALKHHERPQSLKPKPNSCWPHLQLAEMNRGICYESKTGISRYLQNYLQRLSEQGHFGHN